MKNALPGAKSRRQNQGKGIYLQRIPRFHYRVSWQDGRETWHPAFSLHKLRHYLASKMSALNVPEADIMRIGGWETDHLFYSSKKGRKGAVRKWHSFTIYSCDFQHITIYIVRMWLLPDSPFAAFLPVCGMWDSNPHGYPQEPKSCMSANSINSACRRVRNGINIRMSHRPSDKRNTRKTAWNPVSRAFSLPETLGIRSPDNLIKSQVLYRLS